MNDLQWIKEQGFILITTLIFLVILTLLLLSMSENTLLEIKMNSYDQATIIAETAAESALLTVEGSLLNKIWSPPDLGAIVTEHVTAEAADECQRNNYLIDVQAAYQHAVIHLQSQFQVVPKKTPANCVKQTIPSHSLWWQQL